MIPSALALLGCNRYALFLVVDGRGGRPGAADVLFVVDDSASMVEESVALSENIALLVQRLASRQARYGTDGLADAVDRYVASTADPSAFVDFQLALSTTDVKDAPGALVGDVLHRDDPDLADRFVDALVCGATCFPDRAAVPSDPGLSCDDPFDGQVTQELLDCRCGVDAWVGTGCASGSEAGIEAVYAAMCRAVDDPPPECFEQGLTAADIGTNAGLLRPGATLEAIVVTDEGDHSPRVPGVEPWPRQYFELFAALDVPITWAVISPDLTADGELVCPIVADPWGLMRYEYLADGSGGAHVSLLGPDCGPADWVRTVDRLGDWVAGGTRSYVLPRAPVPESIVVEVGRKPVPEAHPDGLDAFNQPRWTDGWTWVPEEGAVLLRGVYVPGAEDEVRIWFLPR